MTPTPYDEQQVVAFQQDVMASYAEAGQPIDLNNVVWAARMTYDAVFMGYPAARTKQLASLRQQLGLTPNPLPPTGTTDELVTRGQFFGLANGTYWTSIECSDFNLLNRWQHGEDIAPVLDQRRACGFNMLRVWTLFDVPGIGTFLDVDYARIPAFLELCATYGLYVELTVFTGTKRLMPAQADQQQHLDRVCEAVRTFGHASALIECGNEWNEGDNAWSLTLRWPTDLLISGGSVGSDTWPTECGLPILVYQEYHSNGAPEWQRKCAHEPMAIADGQHVPCQANENTRYTDSDHSLIHAYDAAAGAALLGMGSCFHSVNGKLSLPWDGDELAAALQWANGAHSVPLEFQDGAYRHAPELEGPDDLRVYQRTLNEAAETVHIRK